MTVRELIKELLCYNLNQEVEICCYSSVGDPKTMVIYDGLVDKNGNTPCQVNMEITHVSLLTDGKTVSIS